MRADNQFVPNRLTFSGRTDVIILSVVVAIVVLIASAASAIYFFGAQLGEIGFTADTMYPGCVSSESYTRAVMHPESEDAYSAYDILAQRHSEVAHQIALQQLDSSDPYLWLNAAEYLGAIGEPKSIPYLIKALRHTAWRGDDETKASLVKLTGTDCGDFNGWQHWWLSSHPDSPIDWESHLGFRPRVIKIPARNGMILDDGP
jgi:hypothetical protein